MSYSGQWHGRTRYFGLHYDFHAGPDDTAIGTESAPDDLVRWLSLMAPDFAQTDCKGHAGYTSWYSAVRGASVSPGVVRDSMLQWREATRRMGLPLHCHYSGIWDKAAGALHPEWCARAADGRPVGAPAGQNAGAPAGEKMCPRSPYVDELMIPQMFELIDRYGVDGFWIDGDLWATEPCYCERCRAAFLQETGLAEPPKDETDSHWPAWWAFTLRSFEAYVARYCAAVHQHKPGVLVCSNWLQTFRNPGEPRVPTDWISGDNSWVWGFDASRCEARFLSTRGKPWDIMLWNFTCSHGMGRPDSPWVTKPVEMLQQEAALMCAFGGNVQIYENPHIRTGRLVPWRMKRLGRVGRFIKARRALCQDTETIPQIAVLHSEVHAHATVKGRNLMHGIDVAAVQGAVFSLLEAHYGVDVLDEWALLRRLSEFPAVVVPEQHAMSDAMVAALKRYVTAGGRLLVSGAACFDRLGPEFLGVAAGEVRENVTFHVPAEEGMAPLYSEAWRLVVATTARVRCRIGNTLSPDADLLPNPACTINRVGRGGVGYIPAAVFRDFARNRYPMTRAFIADCVHALVGRLPITVLAPTCLDVVLRRRGRRQLVHLINRSSGLPNQPNAGAIDELAPAGPARIRMMCAREPRRVRAAFEKQTLAWAWRPAGGGTLDITVPAVAIHLAVVVDG
jgi:hypothetical protein